MRSLSEAELDDIVSVVPESKAYPGVVRRNQTLKQKDELRTYLKEFKVYPEVIGTLKELIRLKFHNSRVPSGRAVGLRAAGSLGSPMTQLVLNTFHTAGMDGGAVESMKVLGEILNASKIQRNRTSFLNFSDGIKKVFIPRVELLDGDVNDFCKVFYDDDNLITAYIIRDDKLLYSSKKMSTGKFNFLDIRELLTELGFKVTTARSSNYAAVDGGFSTLNKKIKDKVTAYCEEVKKWRESSTRYSTRFPQLSEYMRYHTNTVKSFEPPRRSDVVLKAMRDIVFVSLKRLINKTEIIKRSSEFFDTDWKSSYIKTNTKKKIHHKNTNNANYPIMRVHLNVGKMVRYGLVMSDIVNAIDRYVLRRNVMLISFPSPITLGLVDIYVRHIEHSIKKNGAFVPDGYIGANMILAEITRTFTSKIKVSGYDGINDIFPRVTPITTYIGKSVKVSENRWELALSKAHINDGSLKPQQLFLALLEIGYMSFTSRDHTTFTVLSDDDPIDIMNEHLTMEKQNHRIITRKWISEGYVGKRPLMSRLHALLVHVKIYTLGSNLSMIPLNDYLDFNTSTISDVHEVAKTLGIEAAKQHIITRLHEVFSNEGIVVDKRHLNVVASYMTRIGELVGTTFNGASKDGVSVLSKASFGKPLAVIAEAAFFGKTDYLRSLPSSIFLGKRPNIGSKANEDSTAMRKLLDWIIEVMFMINPEQVVGRIPPIVVKSNVEVFDSFYEKVKVDKINGNFDLSKLEPRKE